MARGIRFQCPDCHVPLAIHSAITDEDNKIYLLGDCPECDTKFHFDIEVVITSLYHKDKEHGN